MSLSIIFSPESDELFASLLKTGARLSVDIRTGVANSSHCTFATILRRQVRDTCTNVVRLSREKFMTAKRFSICLKLNVSFANDWRLGRDTLKFARHLYEIRNTFLRFYSQNRHEKLSCQWDTSLTHKLISLAI